MVLAPPRPAREVIWHDLECGAYRADLPLWRELAAAVQPGSPPASILEVGAGTGRVALDLARRGHRVTALDLQPALLGALDERAVASPPETVCADARTFALTRRDYAACLAPMQTIQLLGGPTGRAAFLDRARAHLRPGGLLACAIVTELEVFDATAEEDGPLSETVQVEGTTYVSRAVRVSVDRRRIRIERERSVLAPGRGAQTADPLREHNVVELDRLSASGLLREGRDAGLSPDGTRSIPATEDHVGSVVVMLRA
jgi:SAM-dependent methyltransferase